MATLVRDVCANTHRLVTGHNKNWHLIELSKTILKVGYATFTYFTFGALMKEMPPTGLITLVGVEVYRGLTTLIDHESVNAGVGNWLFLSAIQQIAQTSIRQASGLEIGKLALGFYLLCDSNNAFGLPDKFVPTFEAKSVINKIFFRGRF